MEMRSDKTDDVVGIIYMFGKNVCGVCKSMRGHARVFCCVCGVVFINAQRARAREQKICGSRVYQRIHAGIFLNMLLGIRCYVKKKTPGAERVLIFF